MRRFSLATAFLFIMVATAIACFTDDDCPGSYCRNEKGICTPDSSACEDSFVTGVVGVGKDTTKVCGCYSTFIQRRAEKMGLEGCKWYADKPSAWRKKYSWAAFCAPNGPKGQEACGRCSKVVNVATRAHEILRIVDKWTNKGGLELDGATFPKLDGNGQGKLRGSLSVKYKSVHCRD